MSPVARGLSVPTTGTRMNDLNRIAQYVRILPLPAEVAIPN